ncbi:MAG: hypothetical protein ACTSVG_03085 [Alphaproteobacteria bacterium]
MSRFIVAAALMAIFAGPASAGLFRVGDLGEMPSRQACMTTAAEVLESYISEYGGLSTTGGAENPESWEVYGWRLRPGDNDIVITCPVVNRQVNAFFTLYSASEADIKDADLVIERVRELWSRYR